MLNISEQQAHTYTNQMCASIMKKSIKFEQGSLAVYTTISSFERMILTVYLKAVHHAEHSVTFTKGPGIFHGTKIH